MVYCPQSLDICDGGPESVAQKKQQINKPTSGEKRPLDRSKVFRSKCYVLDDGVVRILLLCASRRITA